MADPRDRRHIASSGHEGTGEDLLRSATGNMRAVREKRLRPIRDGKIHTDWNGLAITPSARGARVYHSEEYLGMARAATDFILSALATPDGRLLHRYLVLVGDPDAADTRKLNAVLDARDSLRMTVLLSRPGEDPFLDDLTPFTREFSAIGGKATEYVCRNHACELPVTNPESLARFLDAPGDLRHGGTGEGRLEHYL